MEKEENQNTQNKKHQEPENGNAEPKENLDSLNKEQAVYLARCKSSHEDISLYF